VRWYRKAAGQGHAPAWTRLGRMYTFGDGVPQSDVRAYMWHGLAGDNKERSLLAAKMTPAQIAEAQRMSERCLRSNYKDCELPLVAPVIENDGNF
jgi:uncharacterized protein